LRTELEQLNAQRPSVAEVRVAGFLGGVSLRDDLNAEEICDELLDLGFISRRLRGNTLQISPPFTTTDDELRAFVAAIDHVLATREQL
jgi:4-aminobutyrate aminotransferase-like enzyme